MGIFRKARDLTLSRPADKSARSRCLHTGPENLRWSPMFAKRVEKINDDIKLYPPSSVRFFLFPVIFLYFFIVFFFRPPLVLTFRVPRPLIIQFEFEETVARVYWAKLPQADICTNFIFRRHNNNIILTFRFLRGWIIYHNVNIMLCIGLNLLQSLLNTWWKLFVYFNWATLAKRLRFIFRVNICFSQNRRGGRATITKRKHF